MTNTGPPSTAWILPFHPGSRDVESARSLIEEALTNIWSCTPNCVVLIVQDGRSWLPEIRGVDLHTLPTRSGKVMATKIGIGEALAYDSVQYFIVSDYDSEQCQVDASALTEAIECGADAVVGNRYGMFDQSEMADHRLLLNRILFAISGILGQNVTDLPSGLICCNREFASAFVTLSRSTFDAVGFDWLMISFLTQLAITEVSIRAKMRAPHTNGLKLARGFLAPTLYAQELANGGHQAVVTFCKILSTQLIKAIDRIAVPIHLLGLEGEIYLLRSGSDYSFLQA